MWGANNLSPSYNLENRHKKTRVLRMYPGIFVKSTKKIQPRSERLNTQVEVYIPVKRILPGSIHQYINSIVFELQTGSYQPVA
jgi:hypothetical protein